MYSPSSRARACARRDSSRTRRLGPPHTRRVMTRRRDPSSVAGRRSKPSVRRSARVARHRAHSSTVRFAFARDDARRSRLHFSLFFLLFRPDRRRRRARRARDGVHGCARARARDRAAMAAEGNRARAFQRERSCDFPSFERNDEGKMSLTFHRRRAGATPSATSSMERRTRRGVLG